MDAKDPLLSVEVESQQSRSPPRSYRHDGNTSMYDWEENEETIKKDDRSLFADNKPRGVSLIISDSVWLFLHFIQMLAVLQSLSLRWTWPKQWLIASNFIFIFNLDVWEFTKIVKNGTYHSIQGYFTPSSRIPMNYWHILAAWAVLVFIALFGFMIAYIVIRYRKRTRMRLQVAQLQSIYVIMLQILYLPLGITIARLFHCTDGNVLDVDNMQPCFSGWHWAYISAALAVVIFLYILFPVWMVRRTRSEMLDMTADRHEGYLQLKETEYVQGLDALYIIGNFSLFSSFRKPAAYLRPTMMYLSVIMLVIYAGLYNYVFAQAIVINIYLFILLVTFIFLRPFRVTCFNVILIISYLCLNFDCLLGGLITSFNPYTLRSPYLTTEYVVMELAIINGSWLLCFIIFVIYLVVRHYGCCGRCFHKPLWPTMTSDGLAKLTPETRKYVRAILHGRTILEKILKMPPMFAPAHDLAVQIQIINGYCREAEYIRDPIHDTLWDLLDELIDGHERIASKSLFAESVKDSIRMTAEELMVMMPMFVQRLAQREYDFILMKPVKRRLLLKMYILGMFLNGRKAQIEKQQQLLVPAVQKMWNKNKTMQDYEDDGYYKNMYPEKESGLLQRSASFLSLDSLDDGDIGEVLQSADKLTSHHQLKTGANTNQAFIDEILGLDASNSVSVLPVGLAASSESLHNDSYGLRAESVQSGISPRPGTAKVRPDIATLRPDSASRPEGTSSPGIVSRTGSDLKPDSAFEPESTSSPGSVFRPGSGLRPDSASRPESASRPGSGLRPGSATNMGSRLTLKSGSGSLPGQAED